MAGGNVAVHVQLPPVLTPLREILDMLLRGQPGGTAEWARLVAVADALESLVSGNALAHPADVLTLHHGGTETNLLCDGGTVPQWYAAVETLRRLLHERHQWPVHVLPTIQEAAINLVRGISAITPRKRNLDRGSGPRKPGGTWIATMAWGTWRVASLRVVGLDGHGALLLTTTCPMLAIDDAEPSRSMFTTQICDWGRAGDVGSSGPTSGFESGSSEPARVAVSSNPEIF